MIRALLLSLAIAGAASSQTLLQDIDREIDSLTRQLHALRRQEFNTEMEGQSDMLEEWHKYIQKLSKAEMEEHQEEKLEKRISELQAQKQTLLK
jgi:hypothetical protein